MTEIDSDKIKSISKKLPKKIAIAYSIQFKETANQIKKILSKKHKITNIMQVLGCSKPNFSKDSEAILLIGSGKFHAISLAIETKKQVYILEENNLIEISKKEIQDFAQSKKGAYMKFLNSNKIGVLISTKPGQQNLKRALNLKIKNKEKYFFISNEINFQEFENFSEIESWINTACPRMDMNYVGVVNFRELNKI